MSDIQQDRYTLAMNMDQPLTVGGNTTIINGDECPALDRVIEQTPIRAADAMWQENDSYVTGVYATAIADLAGS